MGHSESTTIGDCMGDIHGRYGNSDSSFNIKNINGAVTIPFQRFSGFKPTNKSVDPSITIANSTKNSISLYFKREKMVSADLIQDGLLTTAGDFQYLVINPGQSMRCPVLEHLYVTAFAVDPSQPFVCPTGKALFENFLVEGPTGAQKSYIYTCGGIKVAKSGQIWVGDDGVDYEPKN